MGDRLVVDRPAVGRGRRTRLAAAAVLVLGCAGTAGVAWDLVSTPPVWQARVDVVLVPPTDLGSNPWFPDRRGLVDLAGVLAAATAPGSAGTATVSGDVSLVTQGVRLGHRTQQRDDGGQWDHDFREPVVNVQAVGPSAEQARSELERTVGAITDVLRRREAASGVAEASTVRLSLLPAVPVVQARHGSRARTVLGVVLLGAAATGVAVRQVTGRQGEP